jgi:hypothetical protein
MPGFILLGAIFMSLIIVYALLAKVKIDNVEALIGGCLFLSIVIWLLSLTITSFPDICVNVNNDYITIRRLIFRNRIFWSQITKVKIIKTSYRRIPFPTNGEFFLICYKKYFPSFFIIADSIAGYIELSSIIKDHFENTSIFTK